MNKIKKIAKRFLIPALGSLMLASVAKADDVRLSWDASLDGNNLPNPDVAGYKVYCGTSSGVYDSETNVGNVLTVTLPGFIPYTTYFCAVKAFDILDQHSPYSDEAIFSLPDVTPPTLDVVATNTSWFTATAKITSSDNTKIVNLETILNGNAYKSFSNPAPEVVVSLPFNKFSQELKVIATDRGNNTTTKIITSNLFPPTNINPTVSYFDGAESNSRDFVSLLDYNTLASQGYPVLNSATSRAEGNKAYALKLRNTASDAKDVFYTIPKTTIQSNDYVGVTFFNPQTTALQCKVNIYDSLGIIKTNTITIQPNTFYPFSTPLSTITGKTIEKIGIEQPNYFPTAGQFLVDGIRLYKL